MPDPNVEAAKGDLSSAESFKDCLAMGLLPIAHQSSHPTILFRWAVPHIQAPTRLRSLTAAGPYWKHALWVEAWVYALFSMKDSMDVFTNAWTSVQENKPALLALKMDYEEASRSLVRRLAILTEFRMGLKGPLGVLTQEDLRISIDQNLRQVQRELDKIEGRHGTT